MAILGIVMHNFCGWQGNAVSENEFTFAISNISDLYQSLRLGILNAIWNIIAFFGHYGVEIFIFLSGYGLARKHAGSIPKFGTYMRHTLGKLWMLMLPGLLCYGILALIYREDLIYTASRMVYTATFLPHIMSPIMNYIAYGPYWYFGLTLQLYMFYYALVYRRSNHMLLFWSAVVLAVQIAIITISGTDSPLLDQIRANIFIAVPTFCLGVWLARNPIELNPRSWQFAGLMLFLTAIILSTYPHHMAWLFSSMFWPFALIWGVTLLPSVARRLMLEIGVLSPWIFVAHPVCRQVAYKYIAPTDTAWRWLDLAIYLVATVILAILMRQAVIYAQRIYHQRINTRKSESPN